MTFAACCGLEKPSFAYLAERSAATFPVAKIAASVGRASFLPPLFVPTGG